MNKFVSDKIRVVLNDSIFKKLIKNSGIILCGNSVATLLNLISFTIIAKQLGPDLLAVLVLSQTYALIMNDIFNIQTWESMIKFGSGGLSKSAIFHVIKTNLVLDVASAIIAFIFSVALLGLVMSLLGWDESDRNYYLLFCITILFNITTLTIGVPRLFDKFIFIAKIQTLVAIIRLSLVIVSAYSFSALISYLTIYMITNVLLNLLLIIYSMTLLNKKFGVLVWKEKFKIDVDQIRFIWWTNLRTIIRIPVQHFDVIVISTVLSMEMVGIYKVYKEIAGLLNRVGDPVNQAIYPEFTKLIAAGRISECRKLTKKSLLGLSLVGFFISISMILLSDYLLILFFGSSYLNDIAILYCMISLFCISFITVPINSLFIASGFAKYSFFIILFSNIVYLLSSFTLGKYIGIYGVVFAFSLQLLINKGLKIYYLKKYSADWGSTIR